MSWPEIRRQIKDQIIGVTGIGQIHEYVRHTNYWRDLLKRTVKTGRLNVWEISRTAKPMGPDNLGGDSGYDQNVEVHKAVIIGRMAVRDTDSGDKTPSDIAFNEMVDNVTNCFTGSLPSRLNGLLVVPMFPQVEDIGFTMWGTVFVHYCVITLECKERVNVAL